MVRQLIPLVLILFIAGGCVTNNVLKQEDRPLLDAIQLREVNVRWDQPYYWGPHPSLFGVDGVPEKLLKDLAEKNNIDIRSIVEQAMLERLSASGKVKLCGSGEQPKAYMTILIGTYGFFPQSIMGNELAPLVYIGASIHDASGKKIWVTEKATDKLFETDEKCESIHVKDLWKDPVAVQRSWQCASEAAAQMIVGDI